jgi:hypothetical protein
LLLKRSKDITFWWLSINFDEGVRAEAYYMKDLVDIEKEDLITWEMIG